MAIAHRNVDAFLAAERREPSTRQTFNHQRSVRIATLRRPRTSDPVTGDSIAPMKENV
ncbi:MAG: hypothetical protein WKF73_13065 [Nocardioidaceae bacterium]